MAKKSAQQRQWENVEAYLEAQQTVDSVMREIQIELEEAWHPGTPDAGDAQGWKEIAFRLKTVRDLIISAKETELAASMRKQW
jgi:hypothetical protein